MSSEPTSTPSGFTTGSALPFKTQDAILANCLRAAGFQETMLSPLNLYDVDILFKLGGGIKDKDGRVERPSRFAGMNIVAAARAAAKAGPRGEALRGRVEYHFIHHPDIQKFCQIYADQTKEIEEGDDKIDASQRLLDLSDSRSTILDSRERIFRILTIALKLRIEFVNRWKKQTPYLLVKDQAAPRTQKLPDGGKLVTAPGGKMVPISAPDQTFKNMGLI